ncbi:DUF262 domain-containing protein [Occallatibacter savannae]|uniref:DUF262 domain-containing protein n=1 Tax=Occallatibacter savannae TaxID=1002691 RepID=UPI000D69DB8A|nr:DUF262 domain-containing protein [Occallatibacter savannae]
MPKTPEGALADKLFPSEEPHADSILSIPPEQRRLHTETYDFSIATIYDKLNSREKSLFIPEFQRGYVWKKPQASRLIESLIIQCPIPVIYLSQERDERLSVIDGNQRLQSIRKFLNNEFELSGLTAYPELDGLKFEELDPRFQRHILNRTLRCIVIMKDTHPQVKFDVFERLNSGAIELSPQELRHGIFHGPFVEWVGRTARREEWRRLVHAGNNKRMKAEEFLIRFLALQTDFEHYEKPLAGYLNSFTERNRDASQDQLQDFLAVFDRTTAAVEALLGGAAFAIFDVHHNNRIVSSFNAALFDAEMVAVSRSGLTAQNIREPNRAAFHSDLGELFYDEEFQRTISRATSDEERVRTRITSMRQLISQHF